MWAPKFTHPGNREKLLPGAHGHALHRFQGGARLLHPVHEEVVLAKVREKLLTEKRCRRCEEEQDREGARAHEGSGDGCRDHDRFTYVLLSDFAGVRHPH